MIDPVTVQKIKDTADIVDVVSDYVNLTRRGANYMGLCPFHNERTPSFSVNKTRNFCYCFSCHKGGSPVNFIMEKEGVSYHEALLHLAKKYGIEVKERELTNEEREQHTRREAMLLANEWAKNYFISNLEKEEGKSVGLSYLYGRHVTVEALKAFQLGYSIDNGTDFTEAALKQGFALEVLRATGLTGISNNGKPYDRFRGRVMFPIINTAGKTIAFGGRDLKGGPAKYVNSPESEVYSKSRELYGIFQAKGDIVKENKCYLAEGYLDVISMWQTGVRNVVASSGTALTDGQISLIHRFTDNIVLIYDGDSAGIKASLRGIDMFLSHNLNVKAVLLPDGEDPDSLASKLTPEEFKNFLKENEVDILIFKINVLFNEVKDDPQKKSMAIRSIVESIAHIPDKIKREVYIRESSQLMDIKESTLSSEVGKTRYNIVEQEKLRKRNESLRKELETINPKPEEQQDSKDTNNLFWEKRNELYPLEMGLLYNCLKYGFVELWQNENSEIGSEPDPITVLEFIATELSEDGINFTNPDFSMIFSELLNLLPIFRKDLLNYEKVIEEKIEMKRKEGKDKIAIINSSLTEIEIAEKNLENNLLEFAQHEREIFSKNYILDKFGSHENVTIRKHTNEAFAEKHQLSSLFTKNRPPVTKEDNLIPLLINALNILKNGIIDRELKKLMEELKQLENGETDKEKELYFRIGEILKMRSNMAKDIGDRILDPKRSNKK